MVKCQSPDCTIKKALFNYPNQKAKYCKKHMLNGMVDVIHSKCQKCKKTRPNFNYEGQEAKYCKGCAKPGMVDVTHSKCQKCKKTRPNFNYEGQEAKYCKGCAEPGMVDVKNPKCQKCKKTRPNFNYEGQEAKYCKGCAEPGMVDVTHPKCQKCKKTQPTFNYEGQEAKYCKDCAEHGMVDVKHQKCQKCKKTRPSFNYEGQEAKYCKDCAEPEMVDVVNVKCQKCNKTRPNFNYEGQEAKYCKGCAEPGMVDVNRPKCQESGCNSRANYGKLFGPKEHCLIHRLPNEYSSNHPKCCTMNCKELPVYTNNGDNYHLRCETHKLPNDKNVVEHQCKNCGLRFIINEETLLCNYCSDFILKKRGKIKENRVITLVQSNGFQFESVDKIIPNGCTKYRPDGLIDYVLFEVDLEVDEDQHSSYPHECEIIRMIMIHQDYGGKPVIFIRFNPDSYETDESPCISYKDREKTLINLLKSLRNIKEIKYPLLVCYLYYDGFDGTIRFYSLDSITRKMKEVNDVLPINTVLS